MKHDYVLRNFAADLGRTLLTAAVAGATLWTLAKGSMDTQLEARRTETITAEQLDAALASAEAMPMHGVGREAEDAPAYTAQDLEELAIAIYCETGSDAIPDYVRYYVGDVILNRVESDEFPDTIHDVLTEPSAYGTFAWTGVEWPEYAHSEWEQDAVRRAYDTAENILNGAHSWLYDAGYIWQSEYWQSPDSFYCEGFWFGR